MKILFSTLFSFYTFLSFTQTTPILFIDNSPIKFQGDISLPYWVGEGKSVNLGQNAVTASILEFTVVNNEMQFSQVINLTSTSTVPSGKVWKIEAIGIGNNINYNSINNFSNANYPSIFNSPITFSLPGTYTWKVPPGVTNICIEAWGGGGNGGDGALNLAYNGGGGGGGGYGFVCVDVTPGQEYNLTVASNGAGGETSFGNIITSTNGGNGTDAQSNAMGQGGVGGTSNGTFNLQGYNGKNGTTSVTCTSTSGTSGISGGNGGNGGNGANGGSGGAGGNNCGNSSSTGQNGISPGGGGGGGKNTGNATTNDGGVGAYGQIKIYF